jgi:hypothetical protein
MSRASSVQRNEQLLQAGKRHMLALGGFSTNGQIAGTTGLLRGSQQRPMSQANRYWSDFSTGREDRIVLAAVAARSSRPALQAFLESEQVRSCPSPKSMERLGI